MDIALFIIVMLVLVALLVYLQKDINKLREKYKQDARNLLKESNPSPKELKKTAKCLYRYAGRRSKDEETKQLIKHLTDKLDQISE